jgi:hypothetical protein
MTRWIANVELVAGLANRVHELLEFVSGQSVEDELKRRVLVFALGRKGGVREGGVRSTREEHEEEHEGRARGKSTRDLHLRRGL